MMNPMIRVTENLPSWDDQWPDGEAVKVELRPGFLGTLHARVPPEHADGETHVIMVSFPGLPLQTMFLGEDCELVA